MNEPVNADDLIRRARIKAGMLLMGEPIAFGSDAAIINELAGALAAADYLLDLYRRLHARKVVRDLCEAEAAYASALSARPSKDEVEP